MTDHKPKVALVYDRINKFGGAERVLQMLHEIYPDAPIYTLVYKPDSAPWAKDMDVIPSFVNDIPFISGHHEILAPITPLAFESFNFDEFDLVISVTSADAKAIITKPQTLHLCICLTPTRYLWSGFDEYKNDWKLKLLPKKLIDYLRFTDKVSAQRPDHYIAISHEVKARVKTFYNRDSVVVYPAIDDKFFTDPPEDQSREGYLMVSRLVSYKKIDLVIDAFNKLDKKLTIIGTGKQEANLKARALSNIKFLGLVDDKKLIKCYRSAQALIFPQYEDFGLTPLEAQACGTPVIAYNRGGATETIIPEQTGIMFDQQTPESLIAAIKKFETCKNISAQKCLEQAKNFSKNSFVTKFRDTVESYEANRNGRGTRN